MKNSLQNVVIYKAWSCRPVFVQTQADVGLTFFPASHWLSKDSEHSSLALMPDLLAAPDALTPTVLLGKHLKVAF